jgi:hypothetical protein
VPDSDLVAAQAEAQNTKSNAIDAKWMRRGLTSLFHSDPPRSWRAHPFVCATHVIIKAVDVALEDLLLALVSGGMA